MARNSCVYGHSPSRGMEIYSLQNGLSLLNCNEAPTIVGIQIHVSLRTRLKKVSFSPKHLSQFAEKEVEGAT